MYLYCVENLNFTVIQGETKLFCYSFVQNGSLEFCMDLNV